MKYSALRAGDSIHKPDCLPESQPQHIQPLIHLPQLQHQPQPQPRPPHLLSVQLINTTITQTPSLSQAFYLQALPYHPQS